VSRRHALLNRASPMLMRAAGHAAREAAPMSVISRIMEKKTYELATTLGPTERPQTAHLELPVLPRGRGLLHLFPAEAARLRIPAGQYVPRASRFPA
jgi:hypothetical protein